MKKFTIAMLIAVSVFNCMEGNAQTKHIAGCPDVTVKHHRPIVPRTETIEVNSAVSPAVVEFTKGKIYVNGNVVSTEKHPYADDYTVKITYTAQAPAAMNVMPSKSYTGNAGSALLGVYTTYCGGGAKIDEIIPCSPADKAGLDEGDVITKVNSKEIGSTQDLKDAITGFGVGENVTITYRHHGETETANVKLGDKEKVENNTACIRTKSSDGCHSGYSSYNSCNNCYSYKW